MGAAFELSTRPVLARYLVLSPPFPAHAAAAVGRAASSVEPRRDAVPHAAKIPGVCVARIGDTSGENIDPTKSENTTNHGRLFWSDQSLKAKTNQQRVSCT